MGFFDFFRPSSVSAKDAPKEALPELKSKDTEDNTEATFSKDTAAISYGTKMPIDLIYNYLREDYEDRGYKDALCNPDNMYKNMNKDLIKSNLEILFKQVVLRYKDDLRVVDFHIKTRSDAGLVDVVEQLKTRKETLHEHMSQLQEMEVALSNNEPHMTGMLVSYERGFMRGLAALSMEKLQN